MDSPEPALRSGAGSLCVDTASPHPALHLLSEGWGQQGSTRPTGHEARSASPQLSQVLQDHERIPVICMTAEIG